MKRIHIKTVIGTALMMLFLMACSKILDEQPRSIYEPGFFKTEKGVNGGLTSMYATCATFTDKPTIIIVCLTGTDEATYAQSADQNFKDMDLSGAGSLTPLSSRSDVLWTTAFPNINTASGIIENAAVSWNYFGCPGCRSQILSCIRLLSAGTDFWRGAFGSWAQGN